MGQIHGLSTGTIDLTDTLILHDVLHVHSFNFNHIIVHSLLHQNNCSAHFYPQHCYVKDNSLDLMIMKGDLLNNLYIFNKHVVCTSSLPAVLCGSLSVDGTTWHMCHGHSLDANYKHLSDTLSLSSFSSIDHLSYLSFS